MFPLCNKKWTQITTLVQLIANNTEKYFQWRIDKDFVLGEAPCVEVHIDFGLFENKIAFPVVVPTLMRKDIG